jgi:Icc-related predicted phosphoesterase
VTRTACVFASDLHGTVDRYQKLLAVVAGERPAAVFLGGDLLPLHSSGGFVEEFLAPGFAHLREASASTYPRVFLIPGNDDPRAEEPAFLEAAAGGLWEYAHGRRQEMGPFTVYGYACVPPTPFRLKDWERYDVSRYVDPGCVSPEDGIRTVAQPESDVKWGTIEADLARLVGADSLEHAVFLFHAPPHGGKLDRAALDGRVVDHAPVDVHVGSIAVRRFIETRQPLVTLHGHIHESARLTGSWRERMGRTFCFSAAHDGPELALVRFDLEDPGGARRELL